MPTNFQDPYRYEQEPNQTINSPITSKDYSLGKDSDTERFFPKGGTVNTTSEIYDPSPNRKEWYEYNNTKTIYRDDGSTYTGRDDSEFNKDNKYEYNGMPKSSLYNSSKINSDEIFGLPPAAYYDMDYQAIILNSMPIIELIPGFPSYRSAGSTGLKLYKFDHNAGKERFKNILDTLDIEMPTSIPMKFAFLYESPFTESFNNEYGESMFEDIANFKIPFLQEAKYITGKTTTGEALKEIAKNFNSNGTISDQIKGMFNNQKNVIDRILEMGGFLAGKTISGAGYLATEGTKSISNVSNYGGQVGKLLEGSNIDFPKIWQYSSYSPSYSITIRLINPNPMDDKSYMTYIVKPLSYLVAFMTPISDSESTFSFPLLCKVNCPGLFKIDSGYIQSLDVIKGGENGDIAFKQRPGTIDVRITFSEMYNTLIAMDKQFVSNSDTDRPTLLKYIDNIKGTTTTPDINGKLTGNSQIYSNQDMMQTISTTVSGSPTADDENTSRINITDTKMFELLGSICATNTEEPPPSEYIPKISNINQEDIKNYEELQSQEDKNKLQSTIQKEYIIATKKIKTNITTKTSNTFKSWTSNRKDPDPNYVSPSE